MMALGKLLHKHKAYVYLGAVIIIAVSTLIPIFSHSYFTMHDDQHVARLYLLDQAINQGTLYPRWVDQLGFGFGYPLFNFYPPLIYYVAEFFRSVGFGYIVSIKLMLVVGALVGALGTYTFVKKLYGSLTGLVAAMLFSFFSYRAITVYVRGSFAEYWALSLFPWVLVALYNVYTAPSRKTALIAGCAMALLILAHPFVALPASFFIVTYVFTLYISTTKEHRHTFLLNSLLAMLSGLLLSAFFWLPSMIERSHTLVDAILLRELASYALHFVYPQQLWYSPWGFGGSVQGLGDGLSFQINKPYILLVAAAAVLWAYLLKKSTQHKISQHVVHITLFIVTMLFISISLMLPYSKPVWDLTKYLQYLQFPWRFMAFVTFFLSVFAATFVYLISYIPLLPAHTLRKVQFFSAALICFVIFAVQFKYFTPQQFTNATDVERTTFKEIAWRISSTSFEFAPKGVKTKKTLYNTTAFDIDEQHVNSATHDILEGEATVQSLAQRFDHKRFSAQATTPFLLQLHTFNFPGWKAYVNDKEVPIIDNNDYKLIRISVPSGKHVIDVRYVSTPIQKIATALSLVAWVYFLSFLYLSLGRKSSTR
ncbi:MAG: 6-pyruvoyl-tetrahydropterin synthase related domain - membrane protein [Microgenomates bacterium OLB23]|nr:MAG: 6-pyruvoyl-tetrahydropterin synthase related domain - membrane protein [Microgenomates bacterium OLB23]